MYEFNDDNWVETAMLDDTIVASFLLTLNKKTSSSSSTLSPPFNVHWTIRQRRSKPRSHTSKIKIQSRRPSPTTPLSWSSATSASAAATTTDGNEESTRFNKSAHTSRSKIDEQSEGNANKRSRKKRSRTELLEEEQLLLKERGNLKDKLAYMHLTVEKQRANNAGLKKIKLNLVSESENNKNKALTSLVVSGKSKPFLLPDLNLPPEEEHYDNLRLR
ncbi:unnamed protein product [Trifolium pratense]|uniref:Uncharacterized protein n=1 Tax=Trifolium pratense TaxID=57577 RepID=A0ACB0KGC7_TRIPR|nr:unnamed protein product [Trifolium pratense]